MKNIILIIMIGLMSGCGMMQAKVVSSGPRYITIKDDFGATDTHGMAEQYCRRQGMHAQFSRYVNQPVAQCYNGQCQYFGCVQ